ncbi:MAG TPA: TIM barrel protein [Anaerolineaceae bacterium]|nr:TIM barrel protein [Anaerolineaceae bacterium]
MKTSVCIEMIYTEYPFLERIQKAAQQGFDAIEFWNWDNKDMPAIKETAQKAGIKIATFQSNLGGTLIHPEHRAGFIAGIQKSLNKANEMGVVAMFLLTDELGKDRSVRYQYPQLSENEKYESVRVGLKMIAPLAEMAGVTLVLEPLNIYVDHPGYFLHGSALGFDLIRDVDSPNIRLLYDIYHMQVMEGNLINALTHNLDVIGHIHVADVPGRHQPGTGEINYANIFKSLKAAGYEKYVGFEFAPTVPSEQAAAEALSLVRG